MPRHVSIQPGRLYPQPGYTVQIDKEGKWTATQIFLCHRNTAVALMPRPGTVHPEINFIQVSQVAMHELGHVLWACHRPLHRKAFRAAFGQVTPPDYHKIHRREASKTASTLQLSWWPGPHRPAGQPSHYGMTAGGEERFCELIALMHAHGGFGQQPPGDLDDLWQICWSDGLARMV